MGRGNDMPELKKAKRRITLGELIKYILAYILLITIAAVVVYPLIWTIGSSFNHTDSLGSATAIPQKIIYRLAVQKADGTMQEYEETKKYTGQYDKDEFIEITKRKLVLAGDVVQEEDINVVIDLSFRQYDRLFNETQYVNWYKNTFKIAVANMFLSVILTVSAAYVFSRFKFKGKKLGMVTMLVLQMFPSFMGMVAIYILLMQLRLLDSHLGLIIVYAGGQVPYNTWLVKGYFDTIPRSLDEAAKIDGASNMRTFFTIIMPLARPILTFVALTNFMGPWMDFIFPRLILKSRDKFTLAIGLYDMITGKANNQFTMFAAGAVLVAVPITILFSFLQKYITEGLAAGAVKG